MRYSIKTSDRIFVKRYGFLSYAKNNGINVSGKYSQNVFDNAKKSIIEKLFQKKLIENTFAGRDTRAAS